MNIREITQEQDIQQYQDLCKYCFPNSNNWIDHMFPLSHDDVAFGGFKEETLQSATTSKAFTATLFNQEIKMSGVSMVVSAPEGRNAGYTREILRHTLQHEFERGMIVSALYPFLFQFYEKMGYGPIGGLTVYTFTPEEIRPFSVPGECIPVTSAEQTQELIQMHNRFVRQYDFGADFQYEISSYHERLKAFSAYAYLYKTGGQTRGYLEYRLIPEEPFSKKMQVGRFGFVDVDAFQALLAFIRSHRTQCSEVTLRVPENVELRPAFQEPRIKVEPLANWMARPLDVEAVLHLRLAQNPCEKDITFSIEDPLLEQNTGTYTLQGTEMVKTEHTGQHSLSFDVFSSLLFRAITFEQVYYAGRVNWYNEALAAYFSKKGNIYVSGSF